MTEKPLAVRFTDDQISRFDQLAAELSARAAGTRVTRSDAIRAAAERGLEALEADLGIAKKRKR